MAVRGSHHGDVSTDVVEPDVLVHPRPLDRRLAFQLDRTLLEATDGDRASYMDIAEVIEVEGVQTTADLQQLWRRIALNILISNTDDHLRNHGFLRHSSAGWTLAPAFDMNPEPAGDPKYLSTAIDGDDRTASIEILLEIAPVFRLERGPGCPTLDDVVKATAGWAETARKYGLPPPR